MLPLLRETLVTGIRFHQGGIITSGTHQATRPDRTTKLLDHESSPTTQCQIQLVVNVKLSDRQYPISSVISRPQPRNLSNVGLSRAGGRSLTAVRDDRLKGRLPIGQLDIDNALKMARRKGGCRSREYDNLTLATDTE